MKNPLEAFKQKLQSGFFWFWMRQWRTTFLVLGLMIVVGLSAVMTIPKESSPEVQLGVVLVNTLYPGGNPSDIDALITEKIEKKIKNLEGVKKLTSTSRKNISTIAVELDDKVETTAMSSKIRDALTQLSFPENVEKPLVTEVTMKRNQLFTLMLYAQHSAMDTNYLRSKAELLKRNLEGKAGIDTIEVDGGNTYTLEVLIDKNKIESLGLSLTQLAGMLQSATNNQPLGNHQLGTMKYDFRIEGELRSEEDLQNLPIALGNGKSIPLGQLARFKKVYQDPDTLLHIGQAGEETGKLAVSIQCSKKAGASILSASKTAKLALEQELKKAEYEGVGSFYTMDVGAYIGEDYQSLAVNGLSTLLVVFLIVLVFVGAKESLIATLSIPLAFFVTFFVLKAMGLSLNFLTNFSLIICLGIAIDTATVIIQGASENMKAGYTPMHAALLSVKTYKNSLISGTATTVVVFLPMLTLPGIMGKFLAYIPTTIFITLIASLFISLTITPALFFKFSNNQKKYKVDREMEELLSPEEQALLAEDRKEKTEKKTQEAPTFHERIFTPLLNRYERKLTPLLATSKSRILMILIPVILLIMTVIFISPRLGFLMMPAVDNEYLTLTLTAKEGMTTTELLERMKEVDTILGRLPELRNYTNTLKDNQATIMMRIVPRKERTRDSFSIENELESQLAFLQNRGIMVESIIKQDGPPISAEIGIKLLAENPSQLGELGKVVEDFKAFLKTLPWTKNVKSSSEESPWEFIFTLDKEKLALLGISQREVAPELYFALNGLKAGTLKEQNETHEIKIKYADFVEELSPELLMGTTFTTRNGNLSLASIGSYVFSPTTSKITRENGNITITVQSNLQKSAKAEPINRQLMSFAENYEFPDGISYQKGGETEENADLIIAMMSAFVFALICIFAILVLQFNSYTQPGIILYSVVMGFLGATYGMWITWNPYGMLFLIWFIALTGIVVNNAIILIDTANENLKHGETRLQAMRASAKSRLKPILSTTLTTVIGLGTLTTDGFFAPLARTIIFGLSIATLMTLFVIPALYEDEEIIRYLIARIIFKPLLTLIFPLVGLGGVRILCTMLGIPLFTGSAGQPFMLAFVLTGILLLSRYGYQCTLKGKSGLVQKIVQLQLVNLEDTKIKTKQLIKREVIKRGMLIFPILFAGIAIGIGKVSGQEWIGILGEGIAGVGYLILIIGNLYAIWIDEKRQTRWDKLSKTMMKAQPN